MKSNFDRALDVVKSNIESDPFFTVDTRAFYVAVKCLLKSVEPGKGLYLVRKRHISTIHDYALNVADVTGTIGIIMKEVAVALKQITSWGAGNSKAIKEPCDTIFVERQYV